VINSFAENSRIIERKWPNTCSHGSEVKRWGRMTSFLIMRKHVAIVAITQFLFVIIETPSRCKKKMEGAP